MKRNRKKSIIGLLLCMSMLFAMCENFMIANATEEPSTYCDLATIKSCRENKKAPVIDGIEGKVFAGWYTDETYSTALAANEEPANGAYAKFVDSKTLTVGYQVGKDTLTMSKETKLRLLTSVDSFNYQSVGFDVEVNGKSVPFTSDKVYSTIYGYYKDGTSELYTPKETFSATDSSYFMAFKLNAIPNSAFATEIKVTPKWTTLDGITVTGTPRTIRINEAVTENSVTLTGCSENRLTSYEIYGDLKAGSTLSFDIAFNTTENVTVWVLKNGNWNVYNEDDVITTKNEYYVRSSGWNNTVAQTIAIEIPDNWNLAKVVVQYATVSDSHTVTLSNIKVSDSFSVQRTNEQNATVKCDIGGDLSAGSTLSFDIEFDTTESVTVRVLANGAWNAGTVRNEYYMKSQSWSGKNSIMVGIPKDLNNVQLYITYSNANSNQKVTISNVQVGNAVTMTNHTGAYQFAFDLGGELVGGSTLSFDVNFANSENIAIWLYGNTSANPANQVQKYAKVTSPWSGKQKIVIEIPENWQYARILVRYTNGDGTYTDNPPIISNVQVGNSFAIENSGNSQVADFYLGALTAGSTLSFKANFKYDERIVVWVLGDSSWSKEYICADRTAWLADSTVTVSVNSAAEHARVIIKYMNEDGTYTDNLPTISDIQITTP